MDGHQLYLAFAVQTVCVGEQGHVGQIILQRNFFTAGGFIFVNGLLQFRQIVQPLLTALCAQHFLVAALV